MRLAAAQFYFKNCTYGTRKITMRWSFDNHRVDSVAVTSSDSSLAFIETRYVYSCETNYSQYKHEKSFRNGQQWHILWLVIPSWVCFGACYLVFPAQRSTTKNRGLSDACPSTSSHAKGSPTIFDESGLRMHK